MGTTVFEPLLALQSEEFGSSSMTMPTPSVLLVGRPHVLNDGPKANAWLELMEKWVAIDEL